MAPLTGTPHGDAANELLGFYLDKAAELEDAEQYFMAAIALAFGVETALLAYLLVEFGDDYGGDLEIPEQVDFFELISAANSVDVLAAPINIPSHVRDDGEHPKYIAEEVVNRIRSFRNLIHPAAALSRRYDPRTFTKKDLQEFREMCESVVHSLLYYI